MSLFAHHKDFKHYGFCSACGSSLAPSNASVLPDKSVKHIGCQVTQPIFEDEVQVDTDTETAEKEAAEKEKNERWQLAAKFLIETGKISIDPVKKISSVKTDTGEWVGRPSKTFELAAYAAGARYFALKPLPKAPPMAVTEKMLQKIMASFPGASKQEEVQPPPVVTPPGGAFDGILGDAVTFDGSMAPTGAVVPPPSNVKVEETPDGGTWVSFDGGTDTMPPVIPTTHQPVTPPLTANERFRAEPVVEHPSKLIALLTSINMALQELVEQGKAKGKAKK